MYGEKDRCLRVQLYVPIELAPEQSDKLSEEIYGKPGSLEKPFTGTVEPSSREEFRRGDPPEFRRGDPPEDPRR